MRQCKRYASASSSDIDYLQCSLSLRELRNLFQRSFDQVLRLRTRYQHIRCDAEVESIELLVSGDVLHGHAGRAAVNHRLIVAGFFVGQLTFGVSKEMRTVTAQREHH